jgi:hypothetical protein
MHDSPYGANGARVLDSLGDGESVFNAAAGTSRDGLLDEQRYAREVLYNLELKVPSGLARAAECRRTPTDNGSARRVRRLAE